MPQNIYDNPSFFEAYANLRRSREGLDGAPEWPTMRSLLPEVRGARVIDLGCGYGWFCRWVAERGASSVVGYDLSQRMLERATADTPADMSVRYERTDLETLTLEPDSADLVYSSLALHYLPDVERLVGEVAACLSPGGRLVVSVEHPVATAPHRAEFVDGPAGTPVWALDGYHDEGQRLTDWMAPDVVKYHRTTASYVGAIVRAGLRVAELVDWSPDDEQLAEHPEWRADRGRPVFLLLAADAG